MKRFQVQRVVIAHFLAVMGEWAATVAVLVHAHSWGGARAVGIVSLCVLVPSVVGAPLAASVIVRHGVVAVRVAGFVVQAAAFTAAALLAGSGAHGAWTAGSVVLALTAQTVLRPTGAALLPAVVRTARELTSANLAIAHGDSASALAGPLLAAGLAAAGGPRLAFVGCAVGATIAVVLTAWRTPRIGRPAPATRSERGLRTAVAELRRRPWSIGVLSATAARNMVVGAFDVLLVIVALEALDLGDGGPGGLSALVGAGALLSTVVTTVVVRRSRLSPALMVALVALGVACLAIGGWLDVQVVVVALLPITGVCLSSIDNMGGILLQRSTDPRRLGPLFAMVGLVGGGSQVLGSAIAQVVVAVADVQVAFVVLGALLLSLALVARTRLKDADAHADVPVVEMSLLAGLPMFSPLPPAGLEAVARGATRLEVSAGTTVITQGDTGEAFYAVADGAFDVVMSGEHVRTAVRGSFFGEVALLADVPRTATVRATQDGTLLAVHREPFLVAVVGHDAAFAVAATHVEGLGLDEVRVIDRVLPPISTTNSTTNSTAADDRTSASDPT